MMWTLKALGPDRNCTSNDVTPDRIAVLGLPKGLPKTESAQVSVKLNKLDIAWLSITSTSIFNNQDSRV